MFRNFIDSSIKPWHQLLHRWLLSNRCHLCFANACGKPWCEACLGDLPWWDTNSPPKYPFVDSVTVSFRYDYPIDRLIQSGKYAPDYRLISSLAKLMPKISRLQNNSVIYPVPISKWRLMQRGFNQTSLIASEITHFNTCRVDEVSIHKLMFKSDQSTLNAKGRKSNARTLFGAHPFHAAQHAVIIDDVITTGATVSAVAKILKNNGADQVDVYALAAVA